MVKRALVIQKFAEFSHLPVPAIATACQLDSECWRNDRTLYRPFSSNMSTSTTKFWLLKAEPDARIVKGKNVQVGSWSTYHSDWGVLVEDVRCLNDKYAS